MTALWVLPGALVAQELGPPTCEECRIVLEGAVTAGERDDPIGLAVPLRMATASGGQLFVVTPALGFPGVLTYNPNGEFVELWGSGEGPGEFQGAARVFAHGDEVLVQDIAGLIQVLSADGTYQRSIHGVPTTSVNPMTFADSFLAVPTPTGSIERQLRIFDLRTGEAVGESGPTLDPEGGRISLHLSRSRDGAIWVGAAPGWFERWHIGSEAPAVTLRFAPDWLATLEATYRPTTDPAEAVHDVDLWEDPETGLLWITTVIDAPGGGPGFPEVEPGAPFPDDHFSPRRVERAMNTAVSVVDPAEEVVLARIVLNLVVWQFLEDGRLVAIREDSDGFQWAEILELRLIGP